MDKSIYLSRLDILTECMESIPNTTMGMFFKVMHLAILNLRYEKIAFDHKTHNHHPYILVRDLLDEVITAFKSSVDILFAEKKDREEVDEKQIEMEEKHKDLFNLLWERYKGRDMEEYIDRYKYRLQINELTPLIKNKRCLDIGCGNGNFCFALVDLGAEFAAGIDFGKRSIEYANKIREIRPNGYKCEFKFATVYELPYPAESFDFIIQNGVFHHLDNENKAIIEAHRVLKPGGWFWYYTDGEGGISYDLFDRSVYLLREVPADFVMATLSSMGLSNNKINHITDGMKATYRHTSWKEITHRLKSLGFCNFRRLRGGFDTDFDQDVIEADPYGREKFGEGDLRILAQRIG